MSSSFSANLYNAINPYSSDTYYYCEEIDYRVSRYNVYVEDLRSSLCHRNKNNKFYLKSPSLDTMKVRIQPNIIWRESILRTRALLSDGLLEVQAQIRIITVIAVFDSKNNDNDDDKGWEEVTKIAKVNIARVTRQSEKRNTQL